MGRESAVTKSVSYQVRKCRVCASEVGLGAKIPEDEPVRSGFVVLVGEGVVSISEEHAGNWDAEIKFTGEQSDMQPPDVTGHVLCTECAKAIHDHPQDGEIYRGTIPDELTKGTATPNSPISQRTLAIIIAVVIIILILLII